MAILVLTTLPKPAQARKMAKSIVSAGLAACVNVLPRIESVYRWKGKMRQSAECLLLIKTTRPNWKRLEKFIRQNHPYDVPECIALPITAGLREYLLWLKNP